MKLSGAEQQEAAAGLVRRSDAARLNQRPEGGSALFLRAFILLLFLFLQRLTAQTAGKPREDGAGDESV